LTQKPRLATPLSEILEVPSSQQNPWIMPRPTAFALLWLRLWFRLLDRSVNSIWANCRHSLSALKGVGEPPTSIWQLPFLNENLGRAIIPLGPANVASSQTTGAFSSPRIPMIAQFHTTSNTNFPLDRRQSSCSSSKCLRRSGTTMPHQGIGQTLDSEANTLDSDSISC